MPHTRTHGSSVGRSYVREDTLSTAFFSLVHLIKNLAMDGLQSMFFKMDEANFGGSGGGGSQSWEKVYTGVLHGGQFRLPF